jgi:hypothetical protein
VDTSVLLILSWISQKLHYFAFLEGFISLQMHLFFMEEGVIMRRKVICCVICALMIAAILTIEIPKGVNAQVTEEWVARYNVADFADWANAITVGPSGNIYVTGHSYIGYDSDYATIAYDPNGNELWVARYDGPAGPCSDSYGDYPYDIVVDSSENIYVTGKSRSTGCPYDYGEGLDIATIAYDSSGNQLWLTKYNGPGNGRDAASAMAIMSNGNIIVTGESRGIGTETDFVTIAYDSSGNQLWVARYNGLGNGIDEAYAIVADNILENIYVTGRSTGVDGRYDYATVAYDSNGNELWAARYNSGTVNRDDGAWAIDLGPNGNIYVTGRSDGDFATVAYDFSGNKLWESRIDNGEAFSIAVDNSGKIYVTGSSPGGYHESNYLTVAYDNNGGQLWTTVYNGPGNEFDKAYAIGIDPYDNVIVSGRSEGNGTNDDFATIAYDSNGNEIWIARYNGPENDFDAARAMALDSYGNIYVTGGSDAYSRYADFATIKYSQEFPAPEASINIDPNTLNLKSKGRWVTCYIDLFGYDVNDIDISTILLEDIIPAEWGDIQNETLMVKFDRSEVEDMLSPGTYNLKVTGELIDGTTFEGYSDEIRVIEPP